MRGFWLFLALTLIATGIAIDYQKLGRMPTFADLKDAGHNIFTFGSSTPMDSLASAVTPSKKTGSTKNGGSSYTPPRTTTASHTPAPTVSNDNVVTRTPTPDTTTSEPDPLREPGSPYAGMVTLKNGNAKSTDPDTEYVTVSAESSNSAPIDITGWRLESTITNAYGEIPSGARLLRNTLWVGKGDIMLDPGERAYVITGNTPINVSFHENMCTGYLASTYSFTPSLTKQCPLAADELLQSNAVAKSDRECADYVNNIRMCTTVTTTQLNNADLTSSCTDFIRSYLNYDSCVTKHRNDTNFYPSGSTWRIYLGSKRELWLSKNETVRLLDGNGKVVDVLEY